MLGIIRFFLALCVVATHLSEGNLLFHYWGAFAVFGFYVVSGYLITRVLNETYEFKFYPFATNRFLRLFPAYYIVAAMTLTAIILVPSSANYHAAWTTRYQLSDILGNALLFPFEFYPAAFRIVPPTWSVGVEIINYFLLWLFIGRNRLFAGVTFIGCVAYHMISWAHGLPWTDRYFPAYAAILPFSLGACAYLFRDLIANTRRNTINQAAAFTGFLWFCNLTLCGNFTTLTSPNFPVFYYLNLASFAATIYLITNSHLNKLYKGIGKKLGDLAYPIFLVHWPIGFAMSQLFLEGQRRGFVLLAISIPAIIMVAMLLAKLSNLCLEPLRATVRAHVTHHGNPKPETTQANP